VNVSEYLLMLRKRWRLVALCLLVGVGVAAALTWTITPKYEASTQLFVSAKDAGSDLNGLAQGGQFTQERVQSYADIVDSPSVTATVADYLDNGLTPEQIADEISASAPLNTVLIDVHVTDTEPRRAQAIANAVSDEFALFVNTLETPTGSNKSPVKVSVVKRAALPTAPVSPRKPLNLALGVLVGLLVGIGCAVLRETLDTTIKDPEELQRSLGLATLGAIAYDPDARKRPLIVQSDPHSSRSEAFRQLRTNLQFVDIDHTPRSIVVTSSIPDEGKTTTATNLAIALAQGGMRVLLVEADLRRPRIADYLGIEGAVGLTTVLIGKAQLWNAVQTWGSDAGLHVLPSGPTPPNPSELLGSHGFAQLIREAELSYDLVLVDAPPLLPVTDAAVIATVVSGALLIGRHGHVRHEQLARATQSLRAVDASIYGIVLTMTPSKGPDAYYYGYGYRYQHGKRGRGGAEVLTPMPALAKDPQKEASGMTTDGSGGVVEPGTTDGGGAQRISTTVRTLTSGDARGGEDPRAFFQR
jgi:capsular exopolysaccharide synthesis family protein